jgi:hypothetical protein
MAADRKRLNKTMAIGLDETSFVWAGGASRSDYATTVAVSAPGKIRTCAHGLGNRCSIP